MKEEKTLGLLGGFEESDVEVVGEVTYFIVWKFIEKIRCRMRWVAKPQPAPLPFRNLNSS